MSIIQILNDRAAIQDTIIRAANAMDSKDWTILRACFLDEILTDYSDLRGEPPALIAADDYVAKRKAALTPLKTQHISTNHLITIADDVGYCASQMVIYRRKVTDSGLVHFDTHCVYEHSLRRDENGWKISSIKQIVFWNEGDASIHSGAKL